MEPITLSLKTNNSYIPLKAEQMAVYNQSKVLKAADPEQNIYYLIYYKDQFLNVVKDRGLSPDCHIKKAFEKGIVIAPHHPLIPALTSPEKPIKRQSFQQLFKSLKKSCTPQELALIATYFDSFMEKEKLFKYIQSLYYQHRRDGKMFAGYRIIQILSVQMPENDWVRKVKNEVASNHYCNLYDTHDKTLLKKDPLYYEKILFSQRSKRDMFHELFSFLESQGRWIDQIALSTNHLILSPTEDNYSEFKQLCELHFDDTGILSSLEYLYTHIPAFEPLQQDLLTLYLQMDSPVKVMTLLHRHSLVLSSSQEKKMMRLLENFNPKNESMHIHHMNKFLLPLFQTHPERANSILYQCIEILMVNEGIDGVIEWLNPLEIIPKARPAIQKAKQIKSLINDLDHQYQLGELYYHFRNLDGALECFSWEMELKENDPSPVQWLAKIYNEKGMAEEAKAYQQLYISLTADA
ncbi:tetratricopeptide repeat protein [Halobacillus sp. MO56]